MSEAIQSFVSLSPSSTRSEVSQVLNDIAERSLTISSVDRQELIQVLLRDLDGCNKHGDGVCRLSRQDATQALLTLKSLGKHVSGSKVIAAPANLSTLLSLSMSFEDPEASLEALRCVANALLLIESARVVWVGNEVGGGAACIGLLEKPTSIGQIFLASRILFLCTASESASGNFIRWIVEEIHHGKTIVEVIDNLLDDLTARVIARTEMSTEAMTDLLKFTFNLLLHYPKLVNSEPQNVSENPHGDEHKIMGDYWNAKLDGILAPLLRVFNGLPLTFAAPLTPPLTHVIHCLITIPISPLFLPVWFPGRGDSVAIELTGQDVLSSETDLKNGLWKASPTGDTSFSQSSAGMEVVERAYHILDVSLNFFMPGSIDPDDRLVTGNCKTTGDNTLCDIVGPLTLLLTRLCLADEASKKRLRHRLLPADLDRTHSLEGRSDLLGRCLRLLASVYHPKLKDAMGELLFAVCDSDAALLSSQVGYGNVAGFLFHRGLMNPLGASSATLTTPSGETINPITGTIDDGRSDPQMTDEEKESEAEKLFVLFDRLERSGAILPGQNPMRRALQ